MTLVMSRRDRRALRGWLGLHGTGGSVPVSIAEIGMQRDVFDGHEIVAGDDDEPRTPLAVLVAAGLPAEIFADAPEGRG